MARSKVDLANAALGYLVRDVIRDLDGSNPSAVQTKAHMDTAIEAVIGDYDWPYCRVIRPLDLVSGVELRGWSFAYAAPSDMVKLWRVSDALGKENITYELGYTEDVTKDQCYVYTNMVGAYIRYGSRRATLDRYSPDVFELFALRLAIKCCMPLVKDAKLHQYLKSQYARDLSAAKTTTAQIEPEYIETEFVPELIQVRRGG